MCHKQLLVFDLHSANFTSCLIHKDTYARIPERCLGWLTIREEEASRQVMSIQIMLLLCLIYLFQAIDKLSQLSFPEPCLGSTKVWNPPKSTNKFIFLHPPRVLCIIQLKPNNIYISKIITKKIIIKKKNSKEVQLNLFLANVMLSL